MHWIASQPFLALLYVCSNAVVIPEEHFVSHHEFEQSENKAGEQLPGCRRGTHLDRKSGHCVSCVAGLNYMNEEYNVEQECFPCSRCYGLKHPVTSCTVFQDVVCGCPAGYRDTVENLCAKDIPEKKPAVLSEITTTYGKATTVSSASTSDQYAESTIGTTVRPLAESVTAKAPEKTLSSISDISNIANQGILIIVILLALISAVLLFPAAIQTKLLVEKCRS